MGKSKRLRLGQPGHPYKQANVNAALAQREHGKASLRKAAHHAGVLSPMTVLRWERQDMGAEAREKRIRQRGRHHILTQEQEAVFGGFVVNRNLENRSCTTVHAKSFLLKAFGIHAKKSFLSKLISRIHLSYRNGQIRSPKVAAANALEKAQLFTKELRARHVSPTQLWYIDKTGVYTEVKQLKQIAPKGSGTPKRKTSERGTKDIVYTMLRADGVRGKFYLQTTHTAVPKGTIDAKEGHVEPLSKKARRGEQGFLRFLDIKWKQDPIKQGDVVVTDGEKAFATPLAQEWFQLHGIAHIVIPPGIGTLLDVFDNSYHAVFKYKLQQLLVDSQHVSIQDKIRAAKTAYESVSAASIRHMFDHVGATGNHWCKAVEKLFQEGNMPTKVEGVSSQAAQGLSHVEGGAG